MAQRTIIQGSEQTVQVEAIQGGIPIYSIDQNSQKVEIGSVQYRDYDERRLRVPVMYSREEPDSPHSLGHASGKFEIVDHYEVLFPLLQLGFQPKILKHLRGGSEMMAVMVNPDISAPDTMYWDRQLYPAQEGKGKLLFAIRVWNNLHFGAGIRLTVGFLRILCTNGLISVALGLGNLSFKHSAFSGDRLGDWAGERVGGWNQERHWRVLDPKVLGWPIRALDNVLRNPGAVAQYPKFASEPILQLQSRMPSWGLAKLRDQLSLAQGAEGIEPLDLLNMLTNTANQTPRSNAELSWTMYRRMDPLFKSLYDLVEIGAFETGSSGFGLPMVEAPELN